MDDEERHRFAGVYAEYTDEVLGKRVELSAPDDFGPEEWDSVGYMPPDRRSDNEVYGWSKFYDFFWWLHENGYLDMEAIEDAE